MLKMKVVQGYEEADAAIRSGFAFAIDPREDLSEVLEKGSLVYVPADNLEQEIAILESDSMIGWQPYSDSGTSVCYFTEDDKATVIEKLQILLEAKIICE